MTIVNKNFRNGCLLAWMVLNASFSVFGQADQLSSYRTTVTARIDLAADQLTSVQAETGPNQKVKEVNLQLINGELVLQYEMDFASNEDYCDVAIDVSLDRKPLPIKNYDLLGNTGTQQREDPAHKTVILTHLLENFLDLKGDLMLTINAKFSGTRILRYGVTCDGPRPEFTPKQKLPYYLVVGASAGMIGVAQIFKASSNQTYSKYEHYQRDHPEDGTREAFDLFYKDAQSDHKIYWILQYGGGAILAANVTWFVVRAVRNKRAGKEYDEYCAPAKVGFQPYIGRPESLTGTETGFSLTYHF